MKELLKLNICLFAVVAIALWSCTNDKTGDNVVARVGNVVLTYERLNQMLAEQSLPASNSALVVSQWVNDELLYQAALEQNLQRDASIKLAVEKFRRELLGRTYLEIAMTSGITVTQEEINLAYEANLESFYRPVDEARINHFIIQDRNEARRVRRILARSRSGADRKKAFSTHHVETVVVKRGSLLKPLDDAIFGHNSRGTVLGPLSTDYGYHVVEVLERNKEGSYRDLDDVYDVLRHQLYQNYASLNSIKILDSLRTVTEIEINLENMNP